MASQTSTDKGCCSPRDYTRDHTTDIDTSHICHEVHFGTLSQQVLFTRSEFVPYTQGTVYMCIVWYCVELCVVTLCVIGALDPP